MSAQDYNDLAQHFGHSLSLAIYGDSQNAAVECEDCSEILMDFDND